MSLINRGLPFFLRFACVPAFSALFASLLASFRRRAALPVEILALRHQLGVLQRSVKRPKLSTTDRILWVWLSSVWNEWRTSVFIIKAATVIAWHRKGFRLFWTWKVQHGCDRRSSGGGVLRSPHDRARADRAGHRRHRFCDTRRARRTLLSRLLRSLLLSAVICVCRRACAVRALAAQQYRSVGREPQRDRAHREEDSHGLAGSEDRVAWGFG